MREASLRLPITQSIKSNWHLGAVLASMGLLGFLAFNGIADKGLWLDEAITFIVARKNPSGLFRLLTHSEPYMPLYLAFMAFWTRVAGESATALRAPSALFAIATVPLIYLLGSTLFDRFHGLVGALLFSVHPYVVRFSQEARSYTMAVLFTTLTTLVFIRAVQGSSRRLWIVYGLLAGISVYVHLFLAFVIAAHFIFLVVVKLDRIELRRMAPGVAVLVALGAPLAFFVSQLDRTVNAWISPLSFPTVWATLVNVSGSGLGGGRLLVPRLPPVPLLLALAGFMWTVAVFAGSRSPSVPRFRTRRWGLLLLLLMSAVPVVFAAAISIFKPVFVPRYLIILVPAVMLLTAAGLAVFKSPRVAGSLLLAAMLFLMLADVRRWYQNTQAKPPWKQAALFVRSESAPEDGLIAVPAWTRPPLDYYYNGFHRKAPIPLYPDAPWGGDPFPPDESFEDFQKDFRFEAHPRIWVLRGTILQSFEADEVVTALEKRYRLEMKRHFAKEIEIRLYVRE
jgi:mannosyltransferase